MLSHLDKHTCSISHWTQSLRTAGQHTTVQPGCFHTPYADLAPAHTAAASGCTVNCMPDLNVQAAAFNPSSPLQPLLTPPFFSLQASTFLIRQTPM